MSNKYPPPVSHQPAAPPQFPRGNMPPPPPPRGGGLGSQFFSMMMWGAGVAVAVTGISYLFGGRRVTEVHHQAPPPVAPTHAHKPAANPATTRPIYSCTQEESVLNQCLAAGGNCDIYQKRVTECHKREVEGKL